MMNGVQVFFYGVAYGQFLAASRAAAGGSGGDEPNRPYRPKSGHEADDAAVTTLQPRKKKLSSRRSRRRSRTNNEGPSECPVCQIRFGSTKAVHGHQRSHPERPWRGMEPPRDPGPAAADGRQRRYACERCGAQFDTRQALGGHRASHSGRLGCHWLSKQEPAAVPVAVAPPDSEKMPVVLAFDLNEPVPEQEEE